MGLRQVSTATKWLAGTAAVLTGLITVWEARSVSHAGASSPAVVQPSSSGSTDSGSSGYSDAGNSDGAYSDGNVQAPDAAPAPSYDQPSARSGGS
ncbi:MAG: hypothetical protein ACXWA9_04335 [Acidimicrobiia bacterium]